MIYTTEVQHMCPVAKGAYHGPAPIPEEGKWVQAKEISDISGFTHGIGWCAPQQGACKLTLNIKNGIIEEALVETIGCSGMTHSAAMASEILIGKTILEALNTDLVCDAINTAMRELFLQIVYGRSQSAFSEGGLSVGASLEDLGKGLRSQVGTMFATKEKGPRYLEMAEGYCTRVALNKDSEIIVHNTICSATKERQEAAKELSAKVDAMLVIGGLSSSNTRKLYEICSENCRNTYFIQTKEDLENSDFSRFDYVGITAGASTPNNIIEEVQKYVRNEF